MAHPRIRNVALLGHSGSGKTSLAEALLYRSGAIDSLGRVESGSTASDFTPEEREHQVSIHTSILPLHWRDEPFNLLDTPGYADFLGEIRGAQVAADAALIVVSAVAGVEVGTERVWHSSRRRELSTLYVVNKMDRDNADFYGVMTDVESTLPGNLAAIQIPIGQAESFRGVVDLLHMKAYEWDNDTAKEIPIPDEVAERAKEYRRKLIESIVETDDSLMELYLEDAAIDNHQLESTFNAAVRKGVITPILLASATKVMGIALLLDFMVEGVRHVEDHQPLPTASGEPPRLGRDHPFSARVFKTVIDPYLGKVTLVRVLSGVLKPGETLKNVNKNVSMRVSHLYVPKGKDIEEVKELSAGMIGALTKLDEPQTGDTLTDPALDLELDPIPMPSAVMAVALFPKSRADEDKLGVALHKILDEDPTYRLERNAETGETVLWGMGNMHLDIAVERLKERYGVEVDTKTPKISYRESISSKAEARYRHKKQTGGAGQFGEVALRVAPLERGGGFEFENKVVGGSIPSQFIPSCEKGIRQALNDGVLAGYPVVDVKVTVFDGKHHPVDSKDIAFQIAAAHAFKEALSNAGPSLLEPVMLLKVRVPERYTGDVISDVNTRRGRILGMDTEGAVSLVSAHLPMAEVQTYSPELRSMTGGRGAFSLKFDHYAPVPEHVAKRVLKEEVSAA